MSITISGDTGVSAVQNGAVDLATDVTGVLPSGNGGLPSSGASGNVLTSNGTAWISQALPAGGVTSLNGETGAIVNTDAQDIGSYVWAVKTGGITFGSTYAGSSLSAAGHTTGSLSAGGYVQYAAGTTLSGTWRAMGSVTNQNTYQLSLFVRVS